MSGRKWRRSSRRIVGDTAANGLVLEGSALWPEFAIGMDFDRVGALWLTADEETFRQRIYTNSRYSTKSGREREMVDKFLQRTIAYNARMVEVVNRRGFNSRGCAGLRRD